MIHVTDVTLLQCYLYFFALCARLIWSRELVLELCETPYPSPSWEKVCHLDSSKTNLVQVQCHHFRGKDIESSTHPKHPKNIQQPSQKLQKIIQKDHGPMIESESIRCPGHDRFAGSKRMARAVASRPYPMAHGGGRIAIGSHRYIHLN